MMKRRDDIFLVSLCLAFCVVFGVWVYLHPHSSFSEGERRALSTFPSFCAEDIVDGDFFAGLSRFYGDQFPLREKFISLKALSELTLMRRESNGVILGSCGYLIMNPRYGELSLYEENLESVRLFCDKYRESGIDTDVFFAPRGIDVLSAHLPSIYDSSECERVWEMARDILPDLLSATDKIREAEQRGERVWYRTDHHWTALGAYESYLCLAEHLGKTPLSPTDLRCDTVSEDFRGSCYAKFGYRGINAEKSFLLRYDGDEEYEIIYHSSERNTTGFYSQADADAYEVFLGGNFGHISIRSGAEGNREKLLLVKDSFANSVIPFLAAHYDLEVYDLRYFSDKLSEEIERIEPDRIVILYGIDTAVTDASLKRLLR